MIKRKKEAFRIGEKLPLVFFPLSFIPSQIG